MSNPSATAHSEPAAVSSVPRVRPKPRNPEQITRMHKLRDYGLSYRAIARRFGVHPNAVWYLLSTYPRERAA